jgi:hypothetical protein
MNDPGGIVPRSATGTTTVQYVVHHTVVGMTHVFQESVLCIRIAKLPHVETEKEVTLATEIIFGI